MDPQNKSGADTVRILDPFCGAGGLMLGLKMAMPNAEVICVDTEIDCCKTIHYNLKDQNCHAIMADAAHLPIWPGTRFDIIASGPPCKGFSRSNLQRKKSQGAKAWRDMIFVYAEIITTFFPTVFLMENVEGMRDFPDYIDKLRNHFEKWGYFVSICLMDAADYGVPQYRRRMIWMGSVFEPMMPPAPTHGGFCPRCHIMTEHWFWTIEPGFIETIYVCRKCNKVYTRGSQCDATPKRKRQHAEKS